MSGLTIHSLQMTVRKPSSVVTRVLVGEEAADRAAPSNNVQALREERLLSKAELARRAGVSPLTIDRIERGEECRLDTKRKIILALGLRVTDKDKVFGG